MLLLMCCGFGLSGCSCFLGYYEDEYWLEWTPAKGASLSVEDGQKLCNDKTNRKFNVAKRYGSDEVSKDDHVPVHCAWLRSNQCAADGTYDPPWPYFRKCMKDSGFEQKLVVRSVCRKSNNFG